MYMYDSSPGHVTKMATLPLIHKTLQIVSSSSTQDLTVLWFDTLCMKEMPFKAFANRADSDQAALVRAA